MNDLGLRLLCIVVMESLAVLESPAFSESSVAWMSPPSLVVPKSAASGSARSPEADSVELASTTEVSAAVGVSKTAKS